MPLSISQLPSRRDCLRRAVDLDCDLRGDLWDGPVAHRVRDLSPDGLWLDSVFPLDVGEELVLSLRPPRWPNRAAPMYARGVVARVGLNRRRTDVLPPGMGVRFVDLDDGERGLLARLLVGTPPPLPTPARVHPDDELEAQLVLSSGHVFTLQAEAPLLTSSAPRRPVQAASLPSAQAVRHGQRSRRYVTRAERLVTRKRPQLRLLTA